MKTSEVPVLVVGAGAAGTMLTLELARRGIEARTVDRLPGPATTSRAITVHSRTAEILERIDPELVGRFLERAIHNKGYVLHFVDAEGRRSVVRPGIDFTTTDSSYPYILIHRQDETENFIRDYTRERFGREPEWSTRCIDVRQGDDGVVATLVHTDRGDERETVRCRYLVACDGINSAVRETLKLEQDQSDYKGTVLQNLDAYLHGFPDAEDYVHYCAGTDHFIMVVKLPGGFFRLLLSDRGEAADPNVPTRVAFMNLVDRHFDGVTLGDTVWHSKWESWVRLAHTYRQGNVFLAGDSAHVHSTTGGQGMNCCMQDAYNLGWKLAMVLEGTARPELLDTYEQERRPIAEQVIWAASSLHEIFMGHGKDIAERATRMKDKAFVDAVVGRCSGISYTYRDYVEQPVALSPVPGPAIGDRAPDADLAGGGTLYGLTRHTGFTLLGLPGRGGARPDVEGVLSPFRERYGRVLEAHALDASPSVAAAYGNGGPARLYLIRPDGYIGYRCAVDDAERLEEHLTSSLTL
ncbi:MAG: FAD-dependent monooxygenase [Gammaproteobacteria bacterium]|nr:FAD-dependent monooxygenase [Gammaproteobacteria bacterium]